MTAEELQRIALRLGNSHWCRYWFDLRDSPDGMWLLGVQCYGFRHHPYSGITAFEPIRIEELEPLGFRINRRHSEFLYTIERTNEDGTPYRSEA